MSPRVLLLLAAGLSGCAWINETELDERRDRDRDGEADVQWGGTDCDDRDRNVNTAAEEVCDGVDNNCSGVIDDIDQDGDAGVLYYADTDGDSYGSADETLRACEDPGGSWVTATGDCDDSDDAVNPEADESCNDIDDDCDGLVDDEDDSLPAQTVYDDLDGDGFGDPDTEQTIAVCPTEEVFEGGDCDDGDPEIHPEAEELCDGIDNDCDELVDDDDPEVEGESWYADADDDGYGDADSLVVACEPPFGHVADDTDCDDTDGDIHPFADERCNGLDDNCNGVEDDSAIDQSTWYIDSDGDTYGDDSSTVQACEQPSGYADNADDCDDSEASTYPGADEDCSSGVDSNCDGYTGDVDNDGDGSSACDDCDDSDASVYPSATETCNGQDDDCDGLVDDDDSDLDTSTATTWYPDSDGDGWGDEDSPTISCEAPTGYLEVGQDCDDTDDDVRPDAWELCNDGLDSDCDGGSDDCEHDLGSVGIAIAGSNSAGTSVAGGSDLDGDGTSELILGGTGGTGGAVYIGTGPTTASGSFSGATWTGGAGADAGSALAEPGDTDGDSLDDLLVSGPGAEEAYLLMGPVSTSGALRSADVLFEADSSGDDLASAIAGGNLDGNAWGDVVLSAPGAGGTLTPGAGAVYVFEGPLTASSTLTEADADGTIEGGSAGRQLGTALGVVDTDGDGTGELVVQGYTTVLTSIQGVYVFDRPTGSLDEGDADAVISGNGSNADLGSVVAGGDLDGDGYEDLVLGGPDTSQGRAWVFLGPITTDLGVANADWTLSGESSADEAGASLAVVDDLDGDGTSELLVGAPGGSVAYLLFGGAVSGSTALADADALFVGASAADEAGSGVAGTGDLDGDGRTDLLIGAGGASEAVIIEGSGF